MLVLILAGLIGAFILFGRGYIASRKLESRSIDHGTYNLLHGALARFVMLNKRLPCPANGLATTGAEDTLVDTTTCQSPAGVVPWTTLGLAIAATTDGHGRLISYRVFDGSSGFTRANGLNLADCLDGDTSTTYALSGPGTPGTCNATTHENSRGDFLASKGISVNDLGSAKTDIAYAFLSHGVTGLGAYVPTTTPSRLSLPDASSKEYLNTGSAGTYWILDPSADTVAAEDAAHFDDYLAYRTATELVLAAQSGGRPWPLYTTFDRLNATGSTTPLTGNVNTLISSRKMRMTVGSVAATDGPVMVSVFPSSTRYVSSMVPTANFYTIGAMTLAGGGGNITTAGGEGLTLDFRVKRRFLKITLWSFQLAPEAERVNLTFYDGTAQVAQVTKSACSATAATANFTIDLVTTAQKEFTKVDVQALTRLGTSATSNFTVGSVAACQHDDATHPACTLPMQGGEVANPCP